MTTYYIYTDGSCRNNGKDNAIGAWGYQIYMHIEHQLIAEDVGLEMNTTNQRMELMAMYKACQKVSEFINGYSFDEAYFFTDSAYLHNCIMQKWYVKWVANGWINSQKRPVANQDLWELLIPYFENKQFHFEKCKGHSNNIFNNKVDTMVQMKTAKYIKENSYGSNN